jgi:hypothetical protein
VPGSGTELALLLVDELLVLLLVMRSIIVLRATWKSSADAGTLQASATTAARLAAVAINVSFFIARPPNLILGSVRPARLLGNLQAPCRFPQLTYRATTCKGFVT